MDHFAFLVLLLLTKYDHKKMSFLQVRKNDIIYHFNNRNFNLKILSKDYLIV